MRRNQVVVTILFCGLILLGPILPGWIENYVFLGVGIATAWLRAADIRRARHGIVVLGLVVAVVVVIGFWLPSDLKGVTRKPLGIFLLLATVTFFVYCASLILMELMKARAATRDEIFGAVNLYILIGTFWSYVYSLLELLQPGSFSAPAADPAVGARFMYFSFVTLATVGYGDITPKTPPAQSLAIIEAMMGQFYLAVVVAFLMGLYITQRRSSNRRDPDSGVRSE